MPKSENWQIMVEVKLAQLTQDKHVMTYLEMATYADIPSPHRIHQLAEFLEQLIATDVKLHQPIRAARVISKRNGIPAEGFFDCLAQHGRTAKPNQTRQEFHLSLLAE